MDSLNFMTFSIDDEVNCIEYFEDGLVFIASSQSINLYDMVQGVVISSCSHVGKNNSRQRINSFNTQEEYPQQSQQRQSQNNNKKQKQQRGIMSAIQMKYYPLQKYQVESQIRENKPQQQNKKSKQYGFFFDEYMEEEDNRKVNQKRVLGYLLVHYKLVGLSTYKIVQELENNEQWLGRGQQIQRQQSTSKYSISFRSHLEVKFGSAFLKICSLSSVYFQTNKSKNKELKEKYLQLFSKKQGKSSKQLQVTVANNRILEDYRLSEQNEGVCRQFMVYENDNEMFTIKRVHIDEEGMLQIRQCLQIDEQSANLSKSTVTTMKYMEYGNSQQRGENLQVKQQRSSQQRYLIIGTEGGNMYIYELPTLSNNKQQKQRRVDSQYYLQPIRCMNIRQYLQYSSKKSQQMQYIISGIELIDEQLGVVLVRNCGMLIMEMKKLRVVKQIWMEVGSGVSRGNNSSSNNKKKYYFSDTRLMGVIDRWMVIRNGQEENEIQKLENESSKQKILSECSMGVSLIVGNKNSLKRVDIQIWMNKQIVDDQSHSSSHNNSHSSSNSKVVSKVWQIRTKSSLIQQLNTPLIDNLIVINNMVIKCENKQNQKDKTDNINYNTNNNNIQHEGFKQTNHHLSQSTQSQTHTSIQIIGNFQPNQIFYFTPQ